MLGEMHAVEICFAFDGENFSRSYLRCVEPAGWRGDRLPGGRSGVGVAAAILFGVANVRFAARGKLVIDEERDHGG